MSLPFLETIGLTAKEAGLYELLLRLGEVPAQTIIKESKLKRATAYKVLYSLEKKGLVSQKDIEKKIHFRPESPTKLLELSEQTHETYDRAREDLRKMLPELTSSYILSVERPVVTTYEGEEGIKKANLAVLAEKKEILAYLVINPEIDKRFEKFWKHYYALRKRDKIFVRSITPNTKAGIEYKKRDKTELRETKLVPKDVFPFAIEKNIVGNKVVFFSTQQGKLIATIVENKAIADTERTIFELAWKQADYFDKKRSK